MRVRALYTTFAGVENFPEWISLKRACSALKVTRLKVMGLGIEGDLTIKRQNSGFMVSGPSIAAYRAKSKDQPAPEPVSPAIEQHSDSIATESASKPEHVGDEALETVYSDPLAELASLFPADVLDAACKSIQHGDGIAAAPVSARARATLAADREGTRDE